MTYIQLTYSDLALPALLVVMNGALSVALHLKLERQLAIASARTSPRRCFSPVESLRMFQVPQSGGSPSRSTSGIA